MDKLFTIIIVCQFCLSHLEAHEGGHHHGLNEPVLNRWTMIDGSERTGNFLYGKEDSVVFEGANAQRWIMSLNDFCESDRSLLMLKLKRAEAINARAQLPEVSRDNAVYFGMIALFVFFGWLIQWSVVRLFRSDMAMQGMGLLAFRGVIFMSSYLLMFSACKKEVLAGTPSSTDVIIPRTRTGFLDSAFDAYRPAVTTRSDNTWYYVESNGIPSHGMMVGITSWQQQVPIPQAYSGTNAWSIPLQPVYASVPLSTRTHLMKGAVAIAINGIPIFNALNNRGEDAFLIGELDQWGGHCGRADDYHYHAAPMHLTGNTSNKPIAFALDGFAVYGAKEPDGSSMAALDTCHGHSISGGVYHYHGTSQYPYVVGAMRGKVTLDPATPAPEDQILPQAFARPVRPATTPLKGAIINAFQATGDRAYALTYNISGKPGYVNYSWDAGNLYRYVLIDTGGKTTTSTYQR